jgi:hypothetical protein
MGNVPSTHIFIENLCGAGYEMGFPEDADIKPPGDYYTSLELFNYAHLSNR